MTTTPDDLLFEELVDTRSSELLCALCGAPGRIQPAPTGGYVVNVYRGGALCCTTPVAQTPEAAVSQWTPAEIALLRHLIGSE